MSGFRVLLVAVACLLCGGIASAELPQTPPASPSSTPSQVTVTNVVREIETALGLVKTGMASRGVKLPPFKSATVTLQTTVMKQAGGGFTFLVFTFGKKWSKEQSQTLELVLSLPAVQGIRPTATVAQDLANAILDAAAGVAAAGSPLTMKSVSVELSFVVKSEDGGGLKFTIAPIDISFTEDLTRTAIHKIAFVFAEASAK